MNILIFIRHGEQDDSRQTLSVRGLKQMENAADFLAKTLLGQDVRIITSHGPCAIVSAEIICKSIDTPYIKTLGLEAPEVSETFTENFPGALPAIVITRALFIRSFAGHVAKRFNCINPYDSVPSPDRGTAHAIIIDYDAQTIQKKDF